MFRSRFCLPVCEFSESDIWDRGKLRRFKTLTMKLLDTIWMITGGTRELLIFLFFCHTNYNSFIIAALIWSVYFLHHLWHQNGIAKILFSRHSFPLSRFGQEQCLKASQIHSVYTFRELNHTPRVLLTLSCFKSSTSLTKWSYRIVVSNFENINKVIKMTKMQQND